MQLPFVARLFPDVPVLPALFGCKDGSLALGAARLLSASTADRRVLFVGSTEYEFLPTNPATRARAQAAIAASVSVDLAELEREAGSEAGCSCGAAAALALAAIARGSNAAGALLSVAESPDEPSSGAGIAVMYAAVAYRVAEG
jgi:AmmeMemoRadiSam system protein B